MSGGVTGSVDVFVALLLVVFFSSFELFDEELELVLYLQPITQANNNARPNRA